MPLLQTTGNPRNHTHSRRVVYPVLSPSSPQILPTATRKTQIMPALDMLSTQIC
jgi:hypothetical protein